MHPILASNVAVSAPISIFAYGLLVRAANPIRKSNQAILLLSIHAAIWLILREICSIYTQSAIPFRICICSGSLLLTHIAYTTEVMLTDSWRIRTVPLKLLIVLGIPPLVLPWFNSYALPASSIQAESHGTLYYVYLSLLAGSIGYFSVSTALRIRKSNKSLRSEVTCLAYPACIISTTILSLMLLRKFSAVPIPRSTTSILVILFSLWVSYSTYITNNFDAKELLKRFLRFTTAPTLSFIVALSLLEISSRTPFTDLLLLICLTIIISTGIAHSILAHRMSLTKHHRESTINVLYTTIRRSIGENDLCKRVEELIGNWAQAPTTLCMTDSEGEVRDPTGRVKLDRLALTELQIAGWILPEDKRQTGSTEHLERIFIHMKESGLSALVSSRGPSPVVIALERRANLKPFTRVEAEQLLEFASLAELAFVKVRLLAQLAHSDRLATLGTLCASFAHEIRNPLFAIRTFAQLLPSHYESPEFRLRFSKTVDEEAGRMEMLLTDMMDLSKPRQLHLEPTHINELLLSMFDVISHRGRTLDTVLEYAMDSTHDFVETDPTAIKQIILNLSANAIQAQKESRRARMLKIATSNTPHGLEIAVSDNGPGIPPRMRKKLFVHYQTGKTDGNGLGLSICRELVTNLGGNLSLDPYVHGIGATFRIVLPMTQDPSSNTTNAKPAT